MLRILRAFAWMRWRMLVNSLERTGSRDALERFSLAIQKLGPILAALLMVPSAILLAGLGAAAGFSVARGELDAITVQAAGYILLLLPVVVVVAPLIMPGSGRTNPVRLLLLPISRRTLYVSQCAAALGDPWTIVGSPLMLFFAVGMLAGGAPFAALLTFAATLLLVVFLAGLATLVTSVVTLIFRDRRRGELIALLFIVIAPLLSIVPGLLAQEQSSATFVSRFAELGGAVLWLTPPRLYMTAALRAAADQSGGSLAALGLLAASTVVLHTFGLLIFRRVLDSPASSGGRRTGRMRTIWTRTLPGLSPGASAVALAQVRLVLRTPRGRSVLMSPVILFVFVGLLMYRGAGALEFGALKVQGGVALAAVTGVFCLMSVLPISMNQFAVDGAGLTMILVSPLTETDLLTGKAVGNALIGLTCALACYVAALLVFPQGPPALWVTVPIGFVAVSLIAAPMAAIGSALFPKSVELNSVSGNNAHGLAVLAGMLSYAAGSVPPVVLAVAAVYWLKRPALAPLLVGAWCVIAYLLCRVAFIPARRVFHARRENLAMLS